MTLQTDNFDYLLPADRIAQHPAEPRDASKLLRLTRQSGRISHHIFRELPELLRSDDLLVLNDTYVVPARFRARRQSGGKLEGLFLRELGLGNWEVMLKNAGKCRPGEVVSFEGALAAEAILRENLQEGKWRIELASPLPAREVLEAIGQAPLPPYIHRRAAEVADRQSYQTIYADRPGAVAAPTAGLHFTEQVMAGLRARGIEMAHVTLHVGMGTFLPVKVGVLAEHRMHEEWYEIDGPTAERVRQAKSAGRRIVAVGTTTVRVLETAAAGGEVQPSQVQPGHIQSGQIQPSQGWTNIFIYPPAEFRVVDALVTNFHLPRSTLLMLVAAFCAPGSTDGVSTILHAYRQAIEHGYRFYSYGDAMLIE